MLKAENLNAFYGHIHAVKDFDLELERGQILTVLGPNGAGKTTLLRALAGFEPPFISGKVMLEGKDITVRKPYEKLRDGVSFVLEGKRVFPGLTVLENLSIGGFVVRKKRHVFSENLETVLELFPNLKTMLDKKAGLLSGGEQQMLAIARALMSSPRYLCLDEPSFGLAPKVVEAIFKTLVRLKREKQIGILLVEQDVALALQFSDRAVVMVSGKKQIEGNSKELLRDRKILELYLGG